MKNICLTQFFQLNGKPKSAEPEACGNLWHEVFSRELAPCALQPDGLQ